jgi:hypothetical protein
VAEAVDENVNLIGNDPTSDGFVIECGHVDKVVSFCTNLA